jgi:glycosyltransferase involved in cell wall biosynthesis
MRVGVSLLTVFPGRIGGSETYVRGLLGEFANGHGPDGLTVLANRHVMGAYHELGVPLRLVRSYRPGDSDATRFLAMNAARLAPRLAARDVPRDLDVLHFPVTVPVGAVEGVPRIVSLMDVQHHELPQMFSAMERRLRAWAYDDSARAADLVVTISEHARQGIVAHLGVPAERVRAIPLGVDLERFTPEGPAAAEDLPERYVVYPANFWPHKNHERLVAAWREVRDPSLWLVLTGQAQGREDLLAGAERVRVLGHVPGGQLPALLRGARAMVFPSLFEGFGLPPLEAMACGTPVAASSRGSLGEVIGDAALGFDPEDVEAIARAIERVADDEPLREQLRERGLRRAAGFTWAACAEAHLDAYRAVRAGAPAHR